MRFLICTFKIMSCKKSFGSRGFNSYLTFRGFNTLTPRVSNSWFTFRGLNQYHRMRFLICTFKIMSCKKSFGSRGFNSYLTFRGFNTLTPGVSNSWFTFRGLNHYHKFRSLTHSGVLKSRVLQSGVPTIRSSCNQGSYNQGSYNQGFLPSVVLHSGVLTIRGSYNQGFLQSGIYIIVSYMTGSVPR